MVWGGCPDGVPEAILELETWKQGGEQSGQFGQASWQEGGMEGGCSNEYLISVNGIMVLETVVLFPRLSPTEFCPWPGVQWLVLCD